MIILNRDDRFKPIGCDSIEKLLQYYKDGIIEAVFTASPNPYFTNLFYRFRVTDEFEKFYRATSKDGYSAQYAIGLNSDDDIPVELRTVHGTQVDFYPDKHIGMHSISDCLYVESMPIRVNALINFMQYELKCHRFPAIADYNVSSISHLRMKNASRAVWKDMTFERITDDLYFIPVGQLYSMEGIGFMAPEKMIKAIEYEIRDNWIASLRKYEVVDDAVEQVSCVGTIRGWESDFTLWDMLYFLPFANMVMDDIDGNEGRRYQFSIENPITRGGKETGQNIIICQPVSTTYSAETQNIRYNHNESVDDRRNRYDAYSALCRYIEKWSL